MSDLEKKESIKPFMTGTIAQICRLTLPHLKNILSEPIKTGPLTEYRDYVPMVNPMHYSAAAELYDWFSARSKLVNCQMERTSAASRWSFAKKTQSGLWENELSELEGCYAFGNSVTRSAPAVLPSVLRVFPRFVKDIVLHKPGQRGTGTS